MESEFNRPLTKNEIIIFEKLKLKWKELSVEDIILDGLYSKCIRLVREYFEKYLKVDLKLRKIIDIGLKSVVQLLADKDLVGTEFLLNQMHFDVNQKLYQICFFTPYKQLRDYLITILVERKELNDKELEIIDYCKKLELAYPNRSYIEVKKLIPKFNLINEHNLQDRNENFICKEIVRIHDSDLDTNRYGHVILEWIKCWSKNSRDKVLADSLILNPSLINEIQVDPNVLWNVLIEHNNTEKLIEWINGTESSLFTKKVDQNMIDLIYENTQISNSSKQILLNYLAKLNEFCTIEKNDFNQQLKRIISSQTLFDKKLFKLREESFHVNFINQFLENNNLPIELLWNYLDFYNLSNEDKSSHALLTDSSRIDLTNSNGLKMMLAYRQKLITNLTIPSIDPSTYFTSLSIKNLEYTLNMSQNLHLSNLFTPKFKDHHLTSLALSLYQDVPLSQTESASLEHLLDEYPSLRYVIDTKQSQTPLTIYQLLQEHSEIDVGKFFQWQKSNNLSDELSISQRNTQILSFENLDFSKKFSYKDNLDYSYFLKQHRPFFAYYYFMENMLKKFGKAKKTLIEEARLRTQLILIENFQDYRTVSSCIHFTELLEYDTFRLKLIVNLMNILFDYYIKHGMDEPMALEKCISVFTEFLMDEIEPKELMALFENILLNQMTENYDQKNMFTIEACSVWLPLMCFCKIYNLPYSIKYLHLCAESNKWLMYLLYAQLFQIPRYQVISGLEYFTEIGLKQHLEYALHNLITSKSGNDGNNLLEVTGAKVKNAIKKTENKIASMMSATKWFKSKKKSVRSDRKQSKKKTDSSENDESDEFESESRNNDRENSETIEFVDFYELILDCEKSPDPVLKLQQEALRWQAPVLTVFATYYKNHDKISILCSFLYASMKINANLSPRVDSKNKSILFDLNDLKEAIQIAASRSFLRILSNALRIFTPKSILDIYVEFLCSIFKYKDTNMALKLYSMYKTELIKLSLNKHQSNIPLEWYEEVINKLTRITVLKCNTIDDLNTLTHILGSNNEYKRLIKLIYTLKNNNINVFCDNWLDMHDKSEKFNELCFKCIEELLKMQKFNEADELADYCDISKDRIHLARIGNQIELIRLNNDFEEILEFWKNAHIQLQKIGIKDSDFIDFLKFQNSRSNLMLERIVLLNLICQLVPNDNETSTNLRLLLFHFVVEHKKKNETHKIREVFKKMLLFGRLNQDPVKELVEYIMKEGRVNDFSEVNLTLNEQEKDALNILLYNLVDIGKLAQAYVIAKHFKYFNQDFRILLNMIYICLEMLKPDDLDYSNRSIDTTSFKTTRLTNVLRSLSRPNESNETIKDRVEFLEKLVGLCNYGNKFSKRIKLDFQLSNEILQMPYSKLLQENQWILFKNLLYSQYSDRFTIAKEFVKTYDLNMNTLADFILNEFLLNLKNSRDLNSNLMFDPLDNKQFSRLIKIFDQNINLFAGKLLEKSRQLLLNAKSNEDFCILTELIIRSHDCFTQSCSMEGISNVLQTCKTCAYKLQKAGEFDLMIRLLTGIGHYNEMTYIMDFLWNNNQFDMLFGKGNGKDSKLRLALLNYLKRYHPNDHETYTMITLHFTMHREIAKMLEEAAYEQLKLFEHKKLENTSEILTDLQSILAYFSDAAQSFMKEDCVKQAESCIKKARLIALQIHFLSSGLVILNLNQSGVTKFLTSHGNFWETFIVCEAYDRKSDLPLALFNQFIVNNNEKFFQDFKGYLQINLNTIEEVANRYKLWASETNDVSQQSKENMKKLLKCCKDIGCLYRLASSLDLNEWLNNEIKNQKFQSILHDMILTKKL
ncbi:unnamed protein product [Brachionus calyciflorus]|uniref:Spatacsin C-terminal domain-containing protein n=1 Tax=Brachionus calyciflorus TaxID=104777 RepID=A0A813MT12_9BILA|nr:unnamed protein product [Brachionus calyciflorus]